MIVFLPDVLWFIWINANDLVELSLTSRTPRDGRSEHEAAHLFGL